MGTEDGRSEGDAASMSSRWIFEHKMARYSDRHQQANQSMRKAWH